MRRVNHADILATVEAIRAAEFSDVDPDLVRKIVEIETRFLDNDSTMIMREIEKIIDELIDASEPSNA